MSLKVSNFDPAAPLSGAEIVGVVQAGLNKRTTVADVAAAASGQASDVTLSLASSLAAYPASNSASAINALIAALPRGGVVQFPSGHYLFDGRFDFAERITARGQGSGTSTSGTDATATTLLEFPAGSTGFRIHHWQGQNSRVEGMRVIQTSLLATSQLGSYTAGATTMALNAAGDFVNGQVIQLDGAGEDVVLLGRLFTTNAGSAVVTWTDKDSIFHGNAPGYNGMEIAIAGAGFAPGTTIVSWGVHTATLSGNAANSVSGALATITTPLITEIISGGGSTTLTFADVPVNTKTVTNRKISHCAPAIYSSIQCHTRDFEAFECQAGMVVAGITTGGAVADNGTFFNSYFGGTKFGVVLQGSDAQVNSFYGCNFAGAEIGVLDQSYLGNYFYGCHFAFNMGIIVVESGADTQIIGGYMELGTSYVAPQTGNASFFLTVSMVNGAGFKGLNSIAGSSNQMGAPSLTLVGPLTAQDDGHGLNTAADFAGGITSHGTGFITITNTGTGFGGSTTATGRIRMWLNGGAEGQIISDLSLFLDAESGNMEFRLANVTMASVENYGLNLPTGKVLKVAGTQVVGPQGASLPADATDLPTALTLVNAMKARGKATGGHGLWAD